MYVPSSSSSNNNAYLLLDICINLLCSACLQAIKEDSEARQRFHPKHVKNSQALKNVAEHVIKCLPREEVVTGNAVFIYACC